MKAVVLIPVVFGGFLVGKVWADTRQRSPRSPLQGISLLSWEHFVALMAVAPKNHIGKGGKLGTFQMNARHLKDTGAMTAAVKGQRGNEIGVWVGKWSPGLTEEKFLGSMPLQYAVFVRSARAAAPKVSSMVGVEVEGKKASLSGLLGVVHAAGEGGVRSWVESEDVRKRFPSTTALFHKTNGVF